MRTLTIAAIAAVGLSADLAAAADFPNPYADQSYAPAIEQTWTGLYAGGLIGYGWGEAEEFEPEGMLGGVTVGGNYQWEQMLLGLEADISYSGIEDDEGADDFGLDWVGTVRGRIGWAFDRFVVFGTGGYAWTTAEFDGVGTDDRFHSGWTLGAGVEAAITGNISAKLDYLYMDFEDDLYSPGGSIDPDLHTFRLGVNYQF